MSKRIHLAIFASGSGTNAENIARFFHDHETIEVQEIFSNRDDAFVHQRASKLGIPSSTFTRKEFSEHTFLERLEAVDYIILAGFLWLVPGYLVRAFPNRIINIHPALLPKYGGKGMYGDRVHKAVIEAGEKESGITVHLVNEEYDKGPVLFQATCDIYSGETPEALSKKIHALEHAHFPRVIEEYVLRLS